MCPSSNTARDMVSYRQTWKGMAHGGRATFGQELQSGGFLKPEDNMGHADNRYLFSSF
jgi:hypothetical protein